MFLNRDRSIFKFFKKDALPGILIVLGLVYASLTDVLLSVFYDIAQQRGEIEYIAFFSALIILWLVATVVLIRFARKVYFEFVLSASNPKGDIVPRGAVGVTMMIFELGANENDGILKSLRLQHSGGNSKEIERVYVTIDGARISSAAKIGVDGRVTCNFIRRIPIKLGQKTKICINADFARGSSAGGMHRFLIEGEDALIADADEIRGAFPAHGNHFTIGNVTSGLISLSYTAFNGSSVLGRFILAVDQVEHQTLYALTLKKLGNIDDSKIRNIFITDTLGRRITKSVASVIDGYITAIFDPPYTILASNNATFEIHGNVHSSGKIGFSIEEPGDIFSAGSEYGYGLNGQIFGSSVQLEGSAHLANF